MTPSGRDAAGVSSAGSTLVTWVAGAAALGALAAFVQGAVAAKSAADDETRAASELVVRVRALDRRLAAIAPRAQLAAPPAARSPDEPAPLAPQDHAAAVRAQFRTETQEKIRTKRMAYDDAADKLGLAADERAVMSSMLEELDQVRWQVYAEVERGTLTPFAARRQVGAVSVKLHEDLEKKLGPAKMRKFRAAAYEALQQLGATP